MGQALRGRPEAREDAACRGPASWGGSAAPEGQQGRPHPGQGAEVSVPRAQGARGETRFPEGVEDGALLRSEPRVTPGRRS